MSTAGELLVVALGGNALQPSDASGTAGEQCQTIRAVAQPLADLIAAGTEVLLTHGNGPQVGALLAQNALAAEETPPLPMDWLVAQTQATIGLALATALEQALRGRGVPRVVVPLLTRVRVAPEDPAFAHPTKPVGRPVDQAEAARRSAATGLPWLPGAAGWRRVVPSPEPVELLDRDALHLLLDGGAVVIAAGGGGVPMVSTPAGLRGVEAVIDKDLVAALLATEVEADRLLILTDVPAVALRYGTPEQQWLTDTPADKLRALADEGHFAQGSMGPKVEAAVRFVERTRGRAAIGALTDLAAVAAGSSGTQVS